jgi:hypothetical protein
MIKVNHSDNITFSSSLLLLVSLIFSFFLLIDIQIESNNKGLVNYKRGIGSLFFSYYLLVISF